MMVMVTPEILSSSASAFGFAPASSTLLTVPVAGDVVGLSVVGLSVGDRVVGVGVGDGDGGEVGASVGGRVARQFPPPGVSPFLLNLT